MPNSSSKQILFHRVKVLFVFFSFCFLSLTSFCQERFSVGITGSPDVNFYKYSFEKFRDDERANKVSIGMSVGVALNYKLSERIDIYSNVVYSSKHYAPDRRFSFGILRSINMNTIDIPFNIKFSLIKSTGLINNVYIINGLTHQVEISKKANYTFFKGYDNSFDFVSKSRSFHSFPNIGLGIEKKFNKQIFARFQLNYRFFKCHCEYLNFWADKLSFELVLMKSLKSIL